MQEPDLETLLEVLNAWPPETQGARRDDQLIRAVLTLTKDHGHGRVVQVAKAIREIWDNPEHLEMYRYRRKQRLKELADNRRMEPFDD